LSEETPCNPITDYGHSKREAERKAVSFSRFFPVTIIRPPAVYGPRDRALLPLFKLASKRLLIQPGQKPHYTSLVFVKDLAKGIILAAETHSASVNHHEFSHATNALEDDTHLNQLDVRSKNTLPPFAGADAAFDPTDVRWFSEEGEMDGENSDVEKSETLVDDELCNTPISSTPTYFLCHRENPTWKQLGQIISSCIGRKIVRIPLPKKAVYYSAFVTEIVMNLFGRTGMFTREKVEDLYQPYWICSPEKAMRELGFKPRPLEQGIIETVEWYRRRGWL
jgi:nucleoside-diphosphate-sugar epimerase